MAEKIFVDVNIFIDVQRRRQGWKKSIAVLGAVEKGIFEGHISALTAAIVYYLRLPVPARALMLYIVQIS